MRKLLPDDFTNLAEEVKRLERETGRAIVLSINSTDGESYAIGDLRYRRGVYSVHMEPTFPLQRPTDTPEPNPYTDLSGEYKSFDDMHCMILLRGGRELEDGRGHVQLSGWPIYGYSILGLSSNGLYFKIGHVTCPQLFLDELPVITDATAESRDEHGDDRTCFGQSL